MKKFSKSLLDFFLFSLPLVSLQHHMRHHGSTLMAFKLFHSGVKHACVYLIKMASFSSCDEMILPGEYLGFWLLNTPTTSYLESNCVCWWFGDKFSSTAFFCSFLQKNS